MSEPVLEMLTITCESTGTDLSKPTLRLWDRELSSHPEDQVVGALRKCCREVKGRLTLADIFSRLEDGRPSVEEAWSMMVTILDNENASIVWTEEMQMAYPVVAPLRDDPVAARMAFKEKYGALVSEARGRGEQVKWLASLGYDKNMRESVIQEAIQKGRLTLEQGQRICPTIQLPSRESLKLLEEVSHALPTMPTVH